MRPAGRLPARRVSAEVLTRPRPTDRPRRQAQYIARAHEIATLGCICLTFDLRGHVRHQEERESVSREDNLHDVLAAYDALVSHPAVDPAAIAIVGSSYGGYLAAIATALRAVRWLGLRVPALYRDGDWDVPKSKLSRQELALYRNSEIAPGSNRALAACADARSLTYRMIADADHALSDNEWQQTYTSLLVNWMSEMVLGARAGKTGAAAPAPQAGAPPPATRGGN